MTLTAVLVFFCLVSAVITYGLGVYVFTKNPASLSNRLFLAAMLYGAYWAFGEFMIWQAAGYENVLLWLKASAFWPLAIAFLFHFVLSFTGHAGARRENSLYLFLFMYLPALAIALAGIFTDSLFTVGYIPGTGYTYFPSENSPGYMIESVYIFIVIVISLYVGIVSYARATQEKIRRQNGLIAAGIFFLAIFGTLSDMILPSYGIYMPNLVFIGIVIFSLIIVYAIIRHGLFTLSPETAVPDIIRTMPDGLLLVDTDDRIITANAAAAAITEHDITDLSKKALSGVIPQPVCASIKSAVTANGTVSDLEAVLGNDNKTVVSIAASLVKDPNGEPAGIILIIRDITSRKAQEEALRVANNKVSLLNQLTRHDISNLITALSSYLTLLQQKRDDDPARDQYISSCTNLVEKIVRHLRFSREYQEIGTHEPVWQSLPGMVSNAVSDLVYERVAITSRVAHAELYADPLASKVIYNLLENALRHGTHVTQIGISSKEQTDGALVMAIEDNGVGIPDAEKDRIFRWGFGKNTGLGLALSREILSVTGITIAENGVHGRGARFEIRIPRSSWRIPGKVNTASSL